LQTLSIPSNEKYHLAERSDRRGFVPPDMNRPAVSVYHAALIFSDSDDRFLFTFQVNDNNFVFLWPPTLTGTCSDQQSLLSYQMPFLLPLLG
jgi:hypothetical protein